MIDQVCESKAGSCLCVQVYEWMWAKEGLNLGHGADLFVYAVLFEVTAQGKTTYAQPCSTLGRLLGFARETVQRSLTHLVELDYLWCLDAPGQQSGAPRTYALSIGPLNKARATVCGITFDSWHSPDVSGNHEGGADGRPLEAGLHVDEVVPVTEAHRSGFPQETCLSEDPSQAYVTPCEHMSLLTCDNPCQPTVPHTPKSMPLPAQTPVFNNAHISSYLLSPDKTEKKRSYQVATRAPLAANQVASVAAPPTCPMVLPDAVAGLTNVDQAAFEALVARSLLPVDAAFYARNLKAYEALLSAGIPSDAILQAYDDYAAYQHKRRSETGEWRPKHLLHWLEDCAGGQGNVGYVMRAREIERVCAASMARSQTDVRRCHTPRLTCCRDRDRAILFADDDHGSRRIEGAEGIEDLDQVRAIYKRMYEREMAR